MTMERSSVKEVMGFALDHSEEALDVVAILTESLSLLETPVSKKIARLFALSGKPNCKFCLKLGLSSLMLAVDILYNSSAPVKNASAYRSEYVILLCVLD